MYRKEPSVGAVCILEIVWFITLNESKIRYPHYLRHRKLRNLCNFTFLNEPKIGAPFHQCTSSNFYIFKI